MDFNFDIRIEKLKSHTLRQMSLSSLYFQKPTFIQKNWKWIVDNQIEMNACSHKIGWLTTDRKEKVRFHIFIRNGIFIDYFYLLPSLLLICRLFYVAYKNRRQINLPNELHTNTSFSHCSWPQFSIGSFWC